VGEPIEADSSDHSLEPVPARVHDSLFDPYVVLGIMPDATSDEIRAAYEDAKSKFDPGLVSHLGPEVQKYFKARAMALDRAYQLLA
jgi:preprotein translocase subunit Sec63